MLEQRRNFYRMFSEHDKRRGTNFVETFPELEKFWFMCKEMAEKGRIIR